MHRQIFLFFIWQNWVSQGGGNYDGSYDRYFRSIVREKVKINRVGRRETLVLTGYSSLLIGPALYSPSTVLFSPREKG